MRRFLLFVMMLVTTIVNAANLLTKQYIGSVYYNIYDDGTAEATYGTLQSPENYSGDIQIRSSVTVNGKSYTVTAIGEDAFYASSRMTSINIPNTVKSIGSTAFYGCSGLTFIEIPNSVTTIEDKAFQGCSNLKSVTLKCALSSVGNNIFYGCYNLNTVDMSDAPIKIYDRKIFESAYFDNIYLPKTLEIIPNNSFSYKYLKSIELPSSLKTLGDSAFFSCSSLRIVDLSKTSLKTFGKYAFARCPYIEEILFPKTLEVIPEYAFSCNPKWYFSDYGNGEFRFDYDYDDRYNESCEKIEIPNSVKRIEKHAFENYLNLTTIKLGESIEYIGDYAFFIKPYICGDTWSDRCDNFQWVDNDRYIGYVCNKNCTNLIFPNSVVEIGDFAFANYNNLTTIEFGGNLENIGDYAFYGNCALERNLDYDNNFYIDRWGDYEHSEFFDFWATEEGYWANESLKTLYLPESLKSIGKRAFAYQKGLESVEMPNSLTSMGACSFYHCESLKSINLSNSLTSIEDSTFAYCGIKSIDIPNSVKSLGSYSFYDCRYLESVKLSNSIKEIPSGCFYVCSNLLTFTIPNSVTSIGESAFGYCGKLGSITIPSSVTDIFSGWNGSFRDCSLCIVYLCSDHISPDHPAFKDVKKVVSCDNVQMPVEINYAFFYTGEEQLYNIPDFAAYTVTGNRRTEEGTQKVTISLKDGFTWTNGTSDDIVFDFTIYPAILTPEQTVIKGYLGQKLSDLSLPRGCEWIDDPNTVLEYAGENKFAVKYTPAGWTKEPLLIELTVNVTKIEVELPAKDTTEYYYDGNKHTYQIKDTEFYKVLNPEALTKTDVGTTNITIVLKNKANYMWTSGTTDDLSYPFVIKKATVKKPAADETEFVYTGKAQTYTLEESALYTVSNNVQTNIGSYSVRVTLKDQSNYMWENGSSDDIYYTFKIAKDGVKIPDADTRMFMYTGEPITYNIPESDYYTVSGNVQTNVGTYTVRVSLKDRYSYNWKDGSTSDKTYTFKIEKLKVVIPPTADVDFKYNGKPQTYPIASNKGFVTVIGYDSNTNVTGSDSTQTNAGTYNVVLALKDKTNSMWVKELSDEYGYTGNQVYSFTIEPAEVTSYPKGESPEELSLETTYGNNLSDITLPSGYSWVTPTSSVGNVGEKTFAADYSPKDAYNYVQTRVNLKVTVKPQLVPEPNEDLTLYYFTAKPQRYALVTNDLYTVKNNVQTNVGTHNVIVSLKDKDNYAWSSTKNSKDLNYKFVISKSDEAIFELGYNPNEINPKVQYGQKLGDVTLPTRFSWKEPETIADKIGDNKYVVVYTPSDPDNYNTIETEIVVNVLKRKVAFPSKDSRLFVYNGSAQTYEVGESDLYEVSNNVQTNAGRYDVTVALKDKDHYEWQDGTTDDIYQDFIIRTKSIEMPSIASKSFVYDGKSHSLSIPSSKDYSISGNKGTDAGRYEVSLSLVDKKNYVWENNTTSDIVTSFSISKIKVDIPSADNSSFTYTGEPLTYKIAESDLYTVAGNVQTAAGRYDVKVSLNNPRNYEWMDGTTDNLVYVFYIKSLGAETNLAKVDIPSVDTKKFVYDGKNHTLELVDNDLYTVDDKGGINVGRYSATLSLKDKDKYVWENGLSDDISISYLISKAQVAIPTKNTKTYTYNAKNQTYSLASNALYTISNNVQKNAGRYEVKVSLVDSKNYEWEDGSSDDINYLFKINKAKVNAPDADATTFIYSGKPQTYNIVASSYYKVANNVQTNVGSYDVVVSLSDAKNYMWSDGSSYDLTYNFVIKTEDANQSVVKIPVVATRNFIYNGKTQTLDIPESDDYIISDNKRINAGRYVATLTLVDPINTVWSDGTKEEIQYVFNIAKASVEMPDVDHTRFVYTGKPQTYNILSSELYSVTGNIQTKVGQYEVNVALNDAKNYMWQDGTIDDLSYNFVIRAEEVEKTEIAIPSIADNKFVYDGKAHSLNIKSNDDYIVYNNKGVNAGRYTVTLSLTDPAKTVWSDGSTDDIKLSFSIVKAQVQIPESDSRKFVYDGNAKYYELPTSSLYTITNDAQTNAGRYEVNVSLKDIRNYEWEDGRDYDLTYVFTINKAQVEIPAADQTKFVYTGKAQTYKLVADTAYTIDGDEQTMPGKYEVLVSLNDVKNYEWSNGTTETLSYSFVIRAGETELTPVAIPSVATKNFIYDGSAKSLKIASSKNYTVTGNYGVNAGRYTVTLALTDPTKTVWSDGSVDDIKMNFTIAKSQVMKPFADDHDFVYNGYYQTYVTYNVHYDHLYEVTNNVQKNAGKYAVKISLKDAKNYEWEDGSVDDLRYNFTINKAQVEIPIADQTKFVYTGKAQTYKLVADTAYSIEGNKQTLPGKYSVLVSLNDTKNYEWSNGTTETLSYSFVIRVEETELTPVAIPSVATKNFIYDGSAKSLKIASSKNYTVTGNYGVNAGRYTVTLALTDPTKTVWSDGSVDDIKMTFTIDKAQVKIPSANDSTFVYNGMNQRYFDTYMVDYYSVSNNIQKNAGKYAVKISLRDANNYEWENGSVDDVVYNFVINKAQVEIPAADQTKFVYTGKSQTYKLVADTTYLIEGNEQTMPGRYSVLVSLNDTRNYEWSNGTTEVLSYSFVILTEDIELTPVAIPSVATKNFIYDGSAKSLEIASSKNYTVTGNYGVNAGRYTVTIALTDPTKTVWSDGSVDDIKMTFTIDKAMVEIPAADTKNYVYNRRTQIYKIASDTAYTVSDNAHINAGNYLVSVTLNDTKNYMWADGTVDVQKYNFVIAKAQVEIPAADKTVYEYEGMPITYKIAESSLYNVTDNKQTLPGKYEVHVNLVDLKNYEWNDGTTSELTYNFVIRYKAPVKKSIDVPTVLDRIFVYDGSVKSIAIENNAYYTVTGNEGVNAGKYSVRLSLNDPDMTVWSDGSSDDVLMSFQILKARVDMPVADQTKFVYTGKEQTYNIASDSIYTVEGNKQTMPGKYEVLVSLNDDKNYEWANGSIDVLSYNFVIRVKEDSKKVIEIPTNLTRNFIYDGKPKSLDLVSGNGYEVTGNSGVTVGRYSVRLSLTDNKSTVWSDGSIDDIIMTFQISKAQVMIPAADPSKFFYTADSLTYTVAKSDLYTVSGNRQINVGNHDVVISLNDTKNYEWNDGTIGDIVYSFLISKQEIDITTVGIPVVKIKEFTYDGDAHTLDVPSSKYYSVTGNKKTVAGKYVATVSLKDKSTMVWEDGRTDDLKIQYSITKALVKIPAADSTEFVYDGESHTYMIPDSRYYKVSGNEQTLVGRHFVTVSLVDHANYMWADGTSDDLQYEFVIRLKETNITPVAIPVVSKSNFIYNGKSQTLDIKKSDYYTISGNSQKLAGSYTAKVALKDKENTSWADGTTADLVIPFTIAKSSIAIPSANATKFVYNGESMTCSVNKNSDYVISGNTNVEAGNYKAKVSLVDKSNTVWENGSSEDIFIPYSIAKVEVEKPIANTTAFVYNGKEKKLDLASSKWYSITDNSGVLAGKYVANIALVDKANTVWNDGTVDDIEIPFSIAKSQVAIPATSDAKLVYNGDTLIYPVESNSEYAVSGNINVKAGNYQAKVSLYDKENTVWADGSSDDIMIPYSIAKIQLEKPTTDSTSFVYNGDTMTVELTSNEWYDITGNDGVKAGKYVANISLIDKANTVWNDGTTDDVEIPFSIAKAQVEIPTVDTTLFFYTGDTLIYSVAENENYTVKGNAQTMIGRYSVVVSLNDIENYSWSDGSSLDLIYPFIINEREIVKTLVSRPVADTVKLVYNGEMQTLSIEADSNCVVSGNIRKDAGKYLATVSLVDRMTMSWDDGTTDDVIIPFSIVKAQVEIPEADTTVFQFNGEEQTYKIAEDSLYTVEGNVQSLVGRYEVYVSLVDINNYEWTNGTTEDLMYRFAIIHPIVIDTVNIEDIKISGSTIESGDTVVVYDNPGDYIFDITFDSVAKELGFKDVKAEPGDSGIRIIVPEDAKPGNYEATVTIKDIDGTVKDTTLKFSVCYPSTMIKRLMYDVLAVDNNTQEFVSYQWYKDGKKIEGATDQFYCDLDGVKGVYKVEIVNVAGDTLFIAEREFEAIALPFNVTLSKNPVNTGEEFTVTIEGVTESNILATSSLVVYDMKGTVAINKIGIDKRNTISIGNVGEYIVVVRIIGGQTVSKHLLVK